MSRFFCFFVLYCVSQNINFYTAPAFKTYSTFPIPFGNCQSSYESVVNDKSLGLVLAQTFHMKYFYLFDKLFEHGRIKSSYRRRPKRTTSNVDFIGFKLAGAAGSLSALMLLSKIPGYSLFAAYAIASLCIRLPVRYSSDVSLPL